mmetsp:Transcript_22294/g.51306  ORF Transcript_22294/g.51306 Transcript_22294/m.51306 type:complete len:221 (-) Transcript_22294:318-980(-)
MATSCASAGVEKQLETATRTRCETRRPSLTTRWALGGCKSATAARDVEMASSLLRANGADSGVPRLCRGAASSTSIAMGAATGVAALSDISGVVAGGGWGAVSSSSASSMLPALALSAEQAAPSSKPMLTHCERAALCSALAVAAAAAASRGESPDATRGGGIGMSASALLTFDTAGIGAPEAMLGPTAPLCCAGSDKADFAVAGGQVGGTAGSAFDGRR